LSILPVIIYGLISLAKGWFFMPNSVMLKGHMPDLFSAKGIVKLLGYQCYSHMMSAEHIFVLIIVAGVVLVFLYGTRTRFWNRSCVLLLVFIATTCLHLQFADTGMFFRYEAYLVTLGLLAIVIGLREVLPRFSVTGLKANPAMYIASVFVLMVSISPIAVRTALSIVGPTQAMINAYEQQYQMGTFLNKYYSGSAVAANDIGAINFLADIHCVDLFGLGSIEPAQAKRKGRYNTQFIDEFAHSKNTRVAIVYDHWYKSYGGLPSSWIKAGAWKIRSNIVVGGDMVSFYAVDPAEKQNLIRNLQDFSSYLPNKVIEMGLYTETKRATEPE